MNKDKYLYLKRIKERAKKLKQSQKGKTHKEILCEHRQIEKMKLFYESMPLKDQGFKPGVYFLFKDMDLVYIGESQCIMPRINATLNSFLIIEIAINSTRIINITKNSNSQSKLSPQ